MSKKELLNTPDLTWSYPGGPGESAGMVWYGTGPCTQEDIEEIRAFINNPDADIDKLSVKGRYDRDWNSSGYASVGERNPNGGEGSATYEQQKVGTDNVRFAKEPVWHYTVEGEFVKEIPANGGAYHHKYVSDGYYDNVEGPEEGSPAYAWLKGGEYYWDEDNAWYEIRNREK